MAEFNERIRACYQAPARAIARELRDGLVPNYQAELPNAVPCLPSRLRGLRPASALPNCRALWTTNLLRRPFLEERWRPKIILDAFGEKAVLKLTP